MLEKPQPWTHKYIYNIYNVDRIRSLSEEWGIWHFGRANWAQRGRGEFTKNTPSELHGSPTRAAASRLTERERGHEMIQSADRHLWFNWVYDYDRDVWVQCWADDTAANLIVGESRKTLWLVDGNNNPSRTHTKHTQSCHVSQVTELEKTHHWFCYREHAADWL